MSEEALEEAAATAPAPPPSCFNFAEIFWAVAPRVADRDALVCGDDRRTYAELAARVAQLAHAFAQRGVGPGDHLGLCMPNRLEWVEAFLAAMTLRAVPINLNHRYTAAELGPLLARDGAVGVITDASTSPVIDQVEADGVRLGVRLEVGDDYEAALAGQPTEPPEVAGRSGDDAYVIYTGGTTGMPKGVVWRQEDAFYACIGGGDPTRMAGTVTEPAQLLDRLDAVVNYLPIAPLMHAAAQWTTLSWLLSGSKTVLMPGSLEPTAVWDAVDAEAVNTLTMVGDAVGKPLLDAWDAHPGRWSAASLLALSNGGAPMSPALKARIGETFPDKALIDGFGSSETGAQGSQRLAASDDERPGGMTRFSAFDNTVVLDEDLRPVEPGSGTIGRVALSGRIPLRYHGDPDKTVETFVDIDGRRHVITGDMATVEADGTIQLLGRGSACINTGGEKVFGEEVEAALHGHPAIEDVVVVGVDDDRWGEAVCAVVSFADEAVDDPPGLDALRDHVRATLAGYKLPKHLVAVEEVRRSPAGKADHSWARELALSRTTAD